MCGVPPWPLCCTALGLACLGHTATLAPRGQQGCAAAARTVCDGPTPHGKCGPAGRPPAANPARLCNLTPRQDGPFGTALERLAADRRRTNSQVRGRPAADDDCAALVGHCTASFSALAWSMPCCCGWMSLSNPPGNLAAPRLCPPKVDPRKVTARTWESPGRQPWTAFLPPWGR